MEELLAQRSGIASAAGVCSVRQDDYVAPGTRINPDHCSREAGMNM